MLRNRLGVMSSSSLIDNGHMTQSLTEREFFFTHLLQLPGGSSSARSRRFLMAVTSELQELLRAVLSRGLGEIEGTEGRGRDLISYTDAHK